MTSEELLQEYRRHPKRGFDLIYQAFADRLTTYLRRSYNLSFEEISDVVHDAFLPWVADHPRMSKIDNLSGYLFATVRNLALQTRKQRLTPIPETFEPAGPEFQDHLESSLHVEQALQKLPEEQREAVVLKIWGDLSFDEIARLQQVPLQTAAARYRYGLQRLEEVFA